MIVASLWNGKSRGGVGFPTCPSKSSLRCGTHLFVPMRRVGTRVPTLRVPISSFKTKILPRLLGEGRGEGRIRTLSQCAAWELLTRDPPTCSLPSPVAHLPPDQKTSNPAGFFPLA